MSESQIREQAAAFFDEFVDAFGSFDGKQIALRYDVPYLARHANGSCEVFDSGERIAGYFQRIVDGYHGRDCRACRYNDLEALPLGRDAMLGTVTWELLRGDVSVLASWRESYGLARSEGRLKILVSIDHAGQAFE